MSKLLVALTWCLVAAFPLLVLFGLDRVPLKYLAALFVAVAALRLVLLRGRGAQWLPVSLALLLLVVAVSVIVAGDPAWFRLYPVAVNLVLLLVFSASLWRGPPLVERLARLSEPQLPTAAVAYTRKVTVAWCVFFAINGSIALYTALASSLSVWAWYNGVLAYILMAVLFGGEWLLRQRLRRGQHA